MRVATLLRCVAITAAVSLSCQSVHPGAARHRVSLENSVGARTIITSQVVGEGRATNNLESVPGTGTFYVLTTFPYLSRGTHALDCAIFDAADRLVAAVERDQEMANAENSWFWCSYTVQLIDRPGQWSYAIYLNGDPVSKGTFVVDE